METPRIVWVDRDSAEWDRMWSAFTCPSEGEGWQYMGTVAGWHEFRNRCVDGQRRYVRVKAS